MLRYAVFLVLLIACGGGTATLPPTVPPVPTSPPTTIPLAAIDLEPLLIQPGDLPAGITGAQVKDVAPPAFKAYPPATKAIDQRLQRDGETIGGIVVLLYEEQSALEQAKILATTTSEVSRPLDSVGEGGKAFLGSDLLPLRGVTFVRCRAIADVSMGRVAIEEVIAYAKRLDRRLAGVVC